MNITITEFYTVKGCNRIIGIGFEDMFSYRLYIRDFKSWEEVRNILLEYWILEREVDEFDFNRFKLRNLSKEIQKYILNGLKEINKDKLPKSGEIVMYKNNRYIIHGGINQLHGYLLKYISGGINE